MSKEESMIGWRDNERGGYILLRSMYVFIFKTGISCVDYRYMYMFKANKFKTEEAWRGELRVLSLSELVYWEKDCGWNFRDEK